MRYEEVGDDLRPLIYDFLFWFSRFESALKEANWLVSHDVGAPARPGWEDFIAAYEAAYQPSEAATALIAANPMKQIVGGGGLEFAPVTFKAGDSELRRVAILLRTVRNNLFHGGKKGGAGWDDPNRIRQLLPLCIKVLEELAEYGDVQADYTGNY